MGKLCVHDVRFKAQDRLFMRMDQYDRPKAPPPAREQQRAIPDRIERNDGWVLGAFWDQKSGGHAL